MRRDLVQRAMTHDHEAFSELARLSVDKLYGIARLTTLHQIPSSVPGDRDGLLHEAVDVRDRGWQAGDSAGIPGQDPSSPSPPGRR